jgi:hypothetical protein
LRTHPLGSLSAGGPAGPGEAGAGDAAAGEDEESRRDAGAPSKPAVSGPKARSRRDAGAPSEPRPPPDSPRIQGKTQTDSHRPSEEGSWPSPASWGRWRARSRCAGAEDCGYRPSTAAAATVAPGSSEADSSSALHSPS